MSEQESEGIRRVTAELDALPLQARRFISVYAYVLARVARIEPGLSDGERELMERAVIEVGQLTESQAALIVQVAHSMGTLFGATEDYTVTREFAAMASPEQCQALLRTAYAVSGADGQVSDSELAELSEIGAELGLAPELVDDIERAFLADLGPGIAAGDD